MSFVFDADIISVFAKIGRLALLNHFFSFLEQTISYSVFLIVFGFFVLTDIYYQQKRGFMVSRFGGTRLYLSKNSMTFKVYVTVFYLISSLLVLFGIVSIVMSFVN